jgi:hypothetical protein
VLAERLVEEPGGVRQLAVDELDLHPLVAQDPRAATRGLGCGVVGGDHHAGDTGLEDRVGAGLRAPVMTARLERDVEGPARRVLVARGQRHPFGVRLPGGLRDALAYHPPALHEHGPHHGIGTRLAAGLGGQLDGPEEVSRVALLGRGLGHRMALSKPD